MTITFDSFPVHGERYTFFFKSLSYLLFPNKIVAVLAFRRLVGNVIKIIQLHELMIVDGATMITNTHFEP